MRQHQCRRCSFQESPLNYSERETMMFLYRKRSSLMLMKRPFRKILDYMNRAVTGGIKSNLKVEGWCCALLHCGRSLLQPTEARMFISKLVLDLTYQETTHLPHDVRAKVSTLRAPLLA